VAEVDTALEELLHRDDRAHGCGPFISCAWNVAALVAPPFLTLPAMTVAVAVRGSVVPGARWWSDHANAADRGDLACPGCCQGLPVWSADRVARPA
jgi:hypothetical protein